MRFRQSPDENAAVWFILIGSILSLICLSWWISGNRSYRKGWNEALASIKPDTEYVDKPVYIDKPVPVEVKPAGQEFYPVGTVAQLKHVIDSLAAAKPDTTFVSLPIPMETKLYRDEKDSTYVAQITGYNTSLDWIKVNQRLIYINTPIPQPVYPKLLISPEALAMYSPGGLMFGAGLSVDGWKGRWEFGGSAGYGLNFAPSGGMQRGVYVLGKARFNLIRK